MIVYPPRMPAPTENTAQCALTLRWTQGGGHPPPGGYGPPGPGGYGPPPGPGGYGPPPGPGGYGPPPGPGGYGPPGGGGYGPPGGGGYGPPGGGGYGPPFPPRKPITGSPETMAMHAMTIDPRTGLPRGEKPPASIAAVVALVCGILICLGPFTAIPAIVAGLMARKSAREQPQTFGGGRMGTAGVALGSANLVLWLIGLAWIILDSATSVGSR